MKITIEINHPYELAELFATLSKKFTPINETAKDEIVMPEPIINHDSWEFTVK